MITWEGTDLREFIYEFFVQRNYIQFSFQLLICEIPFLIGLKRRQYFPLRAAAVLVQLLLSWGWCRLLTPYGNETFMLPYVFVYIGYALASGLAIWLAFDAAWLEIVFVVAAGYATEHMCFALSRMGLYLLNLPYETSPEHLGHALVTRFGIFPLAALAIYFLAVKGNKKKTEFGNGDLRIAALAASTYVNRHYHKRVLVL